MSKTEIGCCGAYCKPCRASGPGRLCRGCKLGYADGERDIDKARCRIKLCCFRDRHLKTCADCPDYAGCSLIQGFYAKKGYKYGRYRSAVEFIRANGYDSFLSLADAWTGPYGKL